MTVIQFSTGTLWIDEIPHHSQYEIRDVLLFTLENTPVLETQSTTLSFRHRMHDRFGQLGFQYTPDQSGTLIVEVYVTEQDLNLNQFGLSDAFARIVLKEALYLLARNNVFGSGHLVFCYAAEHPVDSSPIVFRLLTRILFTLMTRDLTFTDEEKKTFVFDEMRRLLHDA